MFYDISVTAYHNMIFQET
ncbi:hypothetical protein DW152_09770 [Dorea sp. AM13-35]|nr:hypothetical protein DW152_09770 [Dorea sp. AM13-35]